MSDARSLHCPNCGAAVDPDVRRCPFCKARLATVACPSCFALMFEGAAFCSTCGAARRRDERDNAGVRCPGCRSELQRIAVGSTVILECAACDGVWADADTFERLCADEEARAAVLDRWASKPRGVERVRYRPCVRCGKMMNRVNFGQLSGTVIDVCRGHGAYLDAGELHQIVTFIHKGGLERARQRQIEDLRERERELKELEGKASREYHASNPHVELGFTAGAWSAGPLLDLINMIGGSEGD